MINFLKIKNKKLKSKLINHIKKRNAYDKLRAIKVEQNYEFTDL